MNEQPRRWRQRGGGVSVFSGCVDAAWRGLILFLFGVSVCLCFFFLRPSLPPSLSFFLSSSATWGLRKGEERGNKQETTIVFSLFFSFSYPFRGGGGGGDVSIQSRPRFY